MYVTLKLGFMFHFGRLNLIRIKQTLHISPHWVSKAISHFTKNAKQQCHTWSKQWKHCGPVLGYLLSAHTTAVPLILPFSIFNCDLFNHHKYNWLGSFTMLLIYNSQIWHPVIWIYSVSTNWGMALNTQYTNTLFSNNNRIMVYLYKIINDWLTTIMQQSLSIY